MTKLTLEERFWKKVSIPSDVMDGCWVWTGACAPHRVGDYEWPHP